MDKLTERAAHVRRMAVVDERVRDAGLVGLVRQLVHKHMDLTFMLQKEQVGCDGPWRGIWMIALCSAQTSCSADCGEPSLARGVGVGALRRTGDHNACAVMVQLHGYVV